MGLNSSVGYRPETTGCWI